MVKIIAALLGWQVAGFIGAIIGFYIGSYFDRGLGSFSRPLSSAEQARVGACYFETTFTLLGYLAKADGRISEEEIAQAENLMARMGLTNEHRQQAIGLFKRGAKSDFSLDDSMQQFVSICGRQNNLKQSLLNDLMALALADGELHQSERQALEGIARYLGISKALFEKIIEMIMARAQFNGAGSSGGYASSSSQLDAAYKALGVSADDTDSDIKKVYRKLVSENHPDKLIGQGMPDDMIKLATERTQEIRKAYELIQASRK
ncbi:co-chaperone DjlA [Porticoccaceae bacterium]|jgi:DnaJ like chaperone protein|nr:co-chaperone DjlA [Porticoccaceae bacterium]MDA9569694.1 co-chaperone DjlA [Porticoccaceae bacterium]